MHHSQSYDYKSEMFIFSVMESSNLLMCRRHKKKNFKNKMDDILFSWNSSQYSLQELLADNRRHFIKKNVTCYRCKCRNHDCRGKHIYNVVARHATLEELEEFLQQAIKEEHLDRNQYLQNAISYAIKNPNDRVLDHLLKQGTLDRTTKKNFLRKAIKSDNLKAVAIFFDKIKNDMYLRSQIIYYLKNVLQRGIEQEDINEKVLEMFINEELFDNENVYIYAARYSSKETIISLFDELCNFLGKDNFLPQLNESRSNNDEDVLTILTAREDLTSKDLENITYNMYPAYYSRKTGRSAVILAIEKQKWDFAVFLITKINARECNDNERKGFRKAMKQLETKLDEIPLKEKKKRKSWARALTWKAGNTDQNGRESKLYPNGFRRKDRRRFSKKKKKRRVRRLRHIATTLFHYWKYHLGCEELKGVQVLQVTEESRDKRIVVAFNPMTKEIMKMIQENKVSIKECVEKNLSAISDNTNLSSKKRLRNLSSKKRLRRHCLKLRNKSDSFELWSKPLEFSSVESNKNIQLDKICAGCINILFCENHEGAEERHAEEFLCDAAVQIRQSRPKCKFAIYGKRRPCLTCYVRMKASKIDYYNRHPGYLWLHCIEYQSEEAARNTLRLLLTTLPHVTFEGGKRMSDCGTGSDTEPEFSFK